MGLGKSRHTAYNASMDIPKKSREKDMCVWISKIASASVIALGPGSGSRRVHIYYLAPDLGSIGSREELGEEERKGGPKRNKARQRK